MKLTVWHRRAVLVASAACIGLAAIPAVALAADAPVRGGALVVSADVQPKSLDPIMGDAPTGDRYTLLQIYDSLLKMDETGKVLPSLAESWEYTADNKAIVLHLHKGILFHDGTPFNAEAVAFNIRRTIDPATNALRRTDLAVVDSVDVVDEYTVRVNLKTVSGAALASLAIEVGMMSSPAAIQKYGKDYGLHPVGTGPFVFKDWVSGSYVELERNPDYWRDGADGKKLPYVDRVKVRYITNTAVKMVEVRSGNVHLVDAVTPKDFKDLDSDPVLRSVKVPPGIVQWVTFNSQRKPFDDPRVRKAMSLAMDRELMMKLIAPGFSQISASIAAPTGWDYDPASPQPDPYDPEKAKKLLADAGFPNGLKVNLLVNQRDPDTQIAQIIQQNAKKAGFEVDVQILDRQALGAKVNSRDYEAFMGRINVPRADPDHVFGLSFSRNATQNFGNINDEDLFAAVDRAREAIDQGVRKKAYVEVENMIADKSYYAFLFFREVRHVARRELKNLNVDVGGAWILSEAWLGK